MATRLTYPEKWSKPWFVDLSVNGKLLFFFLCDNCDIAGFYERSDKIMCLLTGLNLSQLNRATSEIARSAYYNRGIYLVRNFIRRQRNLPINLDNNCHVGIVNRLIQYEEYHKSNYKNILDQESYILISPYLGAGKPLVRGYSKSKCKSNRKGKGKSKTGFKAPTVEEVASYCCERANEVDPIVFVNWYEMKGWTVAGGPMTNWKAAVHIWERDAKNKNREAKDEIDKLIIRDP